MRRAMKTVCLAVAALILTAGLAVAAPPDTPSSPSPADGATGVGMLPTLQWTGGNTDTYFVYLNSGGGGTWFKKTASESWNIPIGQALPPDTDFTWQVKARNAEGDTVGPSWSFTTGSYPYIAEVMPTLCRPTYAVDIFGTNFGTVRGAVKLGSQWLDGEYWGKIVRWTNERITIVLPGYRCWSETLPRIYTLRVKTSEGVSNVAKITVTYGGGGTTW